MYIESEEEIEQVVIYDVMGRQVLYTVGANSHSPELNIQHLEAGLYIVVVEFVSERVVREKLVVQKE